MIRDRRRNQRLVRVLGLMRAGYAPCEIARTLGMTERVARAEVLIADEFGDELVSMLAHRAEHSTSFPDGHHLAR